MVRSSHLTLRPRVDVATVQACTWHSIMRRAFTISTAKLKLILILQSYRHGATRFSTSDPESSHRSVYGETQTIDLKDHRNNNHKNYTRERAKVLQNTIEKGIAQGTHTLFSARTRTQSSDVRSYFGPAPTWGYSCSCSSPPPPPFARIDHININHQAIMHPSPPWYTLPRNSKSCRTRRACCEDYSLTVAYSCSK